MHFDVLLGLESSEPYLPTKLILWQLLTIITFITDKPTNRPTWRLYDRPDSEGQVGENCDLYAVFKQYPMRNPNMLAEVKQLILYYKLYILSCFCCSSVTIRGPLLDSERVWTLEFWLKSVSNIRHKYFWTSSVRPSVLEKRDFFKDFSRS